MMNANNNPSNIHPVIHPRNVAHRQAYAHQQIRIIFLLMIGYATFYILRENLPIALSKWCLSYNYTKAETGAIFTVASLCYGFSKFISGAISDRFAPNITMSLALLACGILNISLGFTKSIFVFTLLVGINNCFASTGWGPCAKLLSHWFYGFKLDQAWAICSTSSSIGMALIFYASSWILTVYDWEYMFIIPGLFSLFVAVGLYKTLPDVPNKHSLPEVEDVFASEAHRNVSLEHPSNHPGQPIPQSITPSVKTPTRIIFNKYLLLLGSANTFTYITRASFFNWLPALLGEAKTCTYFESGVFAAIFAICSVIGMLSAPIISFKLFKGNRAFLCATSLLLMVIAILGIFMSSSYGLLILYMILAGICSNVSQMLTGIIAAEIATKAAAATSSGLMGIFGYLGSSIAGIGMGMLLDNYGWNAFIYCNVSCCFVGAIIFCVLGSWRHKPSKS